MRWNDIYVKMNYFYILQNMSSFPKERAYTVERMAFQQWTQPGGLMTLWEGDVDRATPPLLPHDRTPLAMATA